MFAGCTELETIEIPEGVTALPDHLFEYCDSLTTVVLPSTLETIGIYVHQAEGNHAPRGSDRNW